MQNNDFNRLPTKGESGANSKCSRRVSEENLEHIKDGLKALVISKSREKLSLFEKGWANLVELANERKERMINLAAIGYDLDKEEIEKKYAGRLEEIRKSKFSESKESDNVSSGTASDSKDSAKTGPLELIADMNRILERLESKLHFSEEDKRKISDALMLKAQSGETSEETKTEELEHLKAGMEGTHNALDMIEARECLEVEKEAELDKLDFGFERAVKNAEAECERILSHVSNVEHRMTSEKKRTLSALRAIDHADVFTAENMLNVYDPQVQSGGFVLSDADKKIRSNVVNAILFSAATIAVAGVVYHKFNKPVESGNVVAPMVFRVEYHELFKDNSILLDRSVQSGPKSEVKDSNQKADSLKAAQPVKKAEKAKVAGAVRSLTNPLESKVNLVFAIDKNRKQVRKTNTDGFLFFKRSTKSIAAKALDEMEARIKENKLNRQQEAAFNYLMQRMDVLLQMKLKGKKVDLSALRQLGSILEDKFSIKSIRDVRKAMDKAIKDCNKNVKPAQKSKKATKPKKGKK